MEGLELVILIAIGGLGAAIFVVGIIAGIWDWILGIRYLRYNGYGVSNGLTGRQVAEKLLEKNGMTNVKVKACGFWRMLTWGNSYSRKKKTVFLRKKIIDTASLTATTLAAQKVALAIQDKEGDKNYLRRWRYEAVTFVGPFCFVPIILVGVLVDWVVFSNIGVMSLVVSVLALIILGYSIYGESVLIKSEDKANAIGIELLTQNNLVNEAEIPVVQSIYKTYLTRHILKFILSILEFIKVVLQILWKILQIKK